MVWSKMVSFDKIKLCSECDYFLYLVVNHFFRINNSFSALQMTKKRAEAFVFDLYKKQHLTDMLS
jgi:hypothetical protein